MTFDPFDVHFATCLKCDPPQKLIAQLLLPHMEEVHPETGITVGQDIPIVHLTDDQ